MFAVVDNVLLRPLKFRDADRLVSVWGTVAALKTDTVVGGIWNRFTVSYDDYEIWRRQQTAFEEIAAFATSNERFVGPDETRTIPVARASPNFFSMLGTALYRGRSFAEGETETVVV
jgi:starvation-inducible outer membrane lipoprotein